MKILLRASTSPFTNLNDGPLPRHALLDVKRHLAQPGMRNAGNLLFAQAAYKALSAPGVELDVDGYGLTGSDDFALQAGRIDDTYDAFVLPMCNSFRPGYGPSLARATRTIRQLHIPVVVTGIGVQGDLAGGTDAVRAEEPEVRAFVSAVLDRSESIGVRGEITRDYLVGLGFPQDRVDVIGCPSMYYNGAALHVVKDEHPDRVALSLTNADENGTAVGEQQLAPLLTWFRDHPDGVTLIPQVRRLMGAVHRGRRPLVDEPGVLADLLTLLADRDAIAFLFDVVPWIDVLRAHSFAIGTRIHGNVIALLAGTPAHVVVHDSRTLELADYFSIPRTTWTSCRLRPAQDVRVVRLHGPARRPRRAPAAVRALPRAQRPAARPV